MKHPFAVGALVAGSYLAGSVTAAPPLQASVAQTRGCHTSAHVDEHVTVAWTWCDRLQPLFMQRNRTLLFDRINGTFWRKRGPWRCINGFSGRSPVFFDNDRNLWVRSRAIVTLVDSRCVD